MTDISDESREKVQQLQLIEQNLRSSLLQRQNLQTQLVEVESALGEIEKTDTAYKIIGNIMVALPKDQLKKELGEKQEFLSLRMQTLEKQEEKLRSRANQLQSEVLKDMEKQTPTKKEKIKTK
ncbi:TPA: prefoldin subunit beta [Candidatus Woesearchaeota archaeon]|nr:prefoldin subunit beta [Candidatus Woesearchaeota archaeon]HII88359.1 prefoldin subunit beta [Candidatus Woesearchaeota archaeon]